MTPLCELARHYGTDKGGWHQTHGCYCHDYTPTYHQMFGHRRDETYRVLEVGVHYGRSLRMWEAYFPRANIVGLDIYEPHLFTEGRIHCHWADQGNPDTLRSAVAAAGGGMFDLIVDDGSHDMTHQAVTATALLPYLAPGGIYVIEDFVPPCLYERVTAQVTVPADVSMRVVPTSRGLGGLGCQPSCPHCRGATDEILVIYERA